MNATAPVAAIDMLHAGLEWRRHSQNGEDGILARLFDLIGTAGRQFVEIGCEDGTECNTRLLREQGWQGWLFDACHERPEIGLRRALVTRENVAALLRGSGVPEAFDLLSLDIDFNDFHVLDAVLLSHRPRVVVVEHNAALGPVIDAVVPYRPQAAWDGTCWFGASLTALTRLAEHHGYAPVYVDSKGINLFLVDRDCWPHSVPEPAQIYRAPHYGANGQGHPADPQDRPYLSAAHYLVPGAERAYTALGQLSYLRNDEYIGRVFAQGGYWEVEEVRRVAAALHDAEGFAIDVGAHVGSHTVALAHLCPQLSFVCFEPQATLRLLLERNVAENGLSHRVTVSPKAVAHDTMRLALSATYSDGSSADQPIRYDGRTPANYGGVQLGIGGESIEALALDRLGEIPVAYLKLDVEGAESLAFFGARQLIAQQRPLILFEHRSDRQLSAALLDRLQVPAPVRAFAIEPFLQGHGYTMQPLGQDTLAVAGPLSASGPHRPHAPGARRLEPTTALLPTSACPNVIPRLLFQTWKHREGLPTVFATGRRSFLDAHPGFDAPLWDDSDNRTFLNRHFPWVLPLYDAYPKEIYRADLVRYFFLYAHGGIYADLDMICLRPLDPVAGLPHVLLGRMGADPDFEHAMPNAAMASPPRSPFWLLVIAKAIEAFSIRPQARPEYLTGPVVLKAAFDELNMRAESAQALIGLVAQQLPAALQPGPMNQVCALTPRDWFPLDWSDPIHAAYRQALVNSGQPPSIEECRAMFPRSSMVTFWSHSWE